MAFLPAGRRLPALAACLLSAAGGFLDAWVYLGHGHVFANAQTGNVVLAAIALAAGDTATALRHVPSFAAFCSGVVISRLAGLALKRRGFNSRNIRLAGEAVALALLARLAGSLQDGTVTALVGFLAAVQITSFSRLGDWAFNTGVTTGNLNTGLSAAVASFGGGQGSPGRHKERLLLLLCLTFPIGAAAGAAATTRWGDPALTLAAASVLVAAAMIWREPDPVP